MGGEIGDAYGCHNNQATLGIARERGLGMAKNWEHAIR